jgi:hypothetical protein
MFQISIPTPCHEDWQAMTPKEQGRHCNKCEKVVVDFTTMTDDEVQHYFINKAHEKTCGRFYNTQLQEVKLEIDIEKIAPYLTWYKKFALACLIVFGSTLFSMSNALGQQVQPVVGKPSVKNAHINTEEKTKKYKLGKQKKSSKKKCEDNNKTNFRGTLVKGETNLTENQAHTVGQIKFDTIGIRTNLFIDTSMYPEFNNSIRIMNDIKQINSEKAKRISFKQKLKNLINKIDN